MKTRHIKALLYMTAACMLVLPQIVYAQSYLQEGAYYRDPATIPEMNDDSAAPEADDHGHMNTDGTSEGVAASMRVEEKVKQRMAEMDDINHMHGEAMSSDQFNALVAKAQAGDTDAIGQVGQAYEQGMGVSKSEEQAIAWYKRAADYGKLEAYSAIGNLYRDVPEPETGMLSNISGAVKGMMEGGKVAKNDAEARRWYEQGVQKGDAESYIELASMYRDGTGGLKQDREKAKFYYDAGLAIKSKQDKANIEAIENKFRVEAEVEEGLTQPSGPVTLPAATVMLDGKECTLGGSTVTSAPGYTAFFDAACPQTASTAAPSASVNLPGYICRVQLSNNRSTGSNRSAVTHHLLCGKADKNY